MIVEIGIEIDSDSEAHAITGQTISMQTECHTWPRSDPYHFRPVTDAQDVPADHETATPLPCLRRK